MHLHTFIICYTVPIIFCDLTNLNYEVHNDWKVGDKKGAVIEIARAGPLKKEDLRRELFLNNLIWHVSSKQSKKNEAAVKVAW